VEKHAQAANVKDLKVEWIGVAGASAVDICNVF
jgi:hypothetical protein